MKTAYIAGPMTGIPRFNYPLFFEVEAHLVGWFEVINPARFDTDDMALMTMIMGSKTGSMADIADGGMTWGDFVARAIKQVVDGNIDLMVVLPGWEKSKGARLETFIARAILHKPVYAYVDHDPRDPADLHLIPLKPVSFLDLVRAWISKHDISFHSGVKEPHHER